MDVAVYEMMRKGAYQEATAQIAQNIKAKHQSVLQQGDWSAAWLLTGLADPLQRRKFAGSNEEMSIVSGYIEALARVEKKVQETKGPVTKVSDDEEDENAAPGAAARKKRNRKKKWLEQQAAAAAGP
jgi:hypothetical protein